MTDTNEGFPIGARPTVLSTAAYVIAKALLYLLLIALCILLSPDQPVQFIYTEF